MNVMRVLKGGGMPEAVATMDPGPTGLAIDNTYVYWTTVSGTAGALTARKKDLSAAAIPLATMLNVPGQVTVDSNAAYWTEYQAGLVKSVGKPGIGGGVTFGMSQNGPQGIAVDDAHVYWGTFSGGTINSAPKGGGVAPVSIATGVKAIIALTQDTTSLYWTDKGTSPGYADGRVMKIAK
jgi:hypothetical protein